MNKTEKRNYIVRRVKITNIDIKDLTDVEMQTVINKLEEDLEIVAYDKNLMSTADLFAYVALSYAIDLYKEKHIDKIKSKAEEKRLDETITRLEDFLKKK